MRVLLFGATGTVGGAVLAACLESPVVQQVATLARRPLGRSHPKLRERKHSAFTDFAPVMDSFAGVDACLFCLGVSVTRVPGEADYRRITQDYALAAADALRVASPRAAFHYVSGRSTNARGRLMWARVKGETELALMERVGAVCWRPAFVDAPPGASAPPYLRLLQPVGRLFRPVRSLYVEGTDIGRAMLQATLDGTRRRVFENAEIRDLATRFGSSMAR